MNKFENVPAEDDTIILFRLEVKLGEYEVLFEKWNWDGITAESIIFANKDVENLTDTEIKARVKTFLSLKNNSKVTLKRSDSGFTFVNFNFEIK